MKKGDEVTIKAGEEVENCGICSECFKNCHKIIFEYCDDDSGEGHISGRDEEGEETDTCAIPMRFILPLSWRSRYDK